MNRTRWLATGAAGLAVVMGGGAALAATGSDEPTSGFLGDVARHLGVSEDRLGDAIEEATIERIDAAVAAGKITKEEGEALEERARSGDSLAVLPHFGGPRLGVGPVEKGLRPGFPPDHDPIEAAADYLGMDAADVREALREGTSLADLAQDKGKSVRGLKDALRDELRKDADRIGGPPRKHLFPGPVPGIDLMETVADYLEMDVAAVREALHDGKSLAGLAQDKGKSVQGLKDALRDELRKDADRMVDKLVEGNLREGIGLKLRGGGDVLGFHQSEVARRVVAP